MPQTPQMLFSAAGWRPIPVLGTIGDGEGIDFGQVTDDTLQDLLTVEEAAKLYRLDPKQVRQIYIDTVAPWISPRQAALLGISQSELNAARPPPQRIPMPHGAGEGPDGGNDRGRRARPAGPTG